MQTPLSERQLKSLVLDAIAALALASIVGGVMYGYYRARLAKREQCSFALHEIQLVLERYGCGSQSTGITDMYPEHLEQLIDQGSLVLPRNPYTGLPVPLLAPNDPPEPGGVVYLTSADRHLAQPESVTGNPWTKYYNRAYELLMYGDKPGALANARRSCSSLTWEFSDINASEQTDEQRQLLDELDSIAWDNVMIELSSGSFGPK